MHRLTPIFLALVLVACGADSPPAPTATADHASPSPVGASPSPDGATAREYSDAICPVFVVLLGTDPALASLRAAGATGEPVEAQAAQIDAATDELRGILDGLEAVPEWGPGNLLRYQLITSVHAIHTQLLAVSRDPAAPTAPDALATLPYIATEAVDRSMAQATEAGLDCGGVAE